jgi:tetratricopeptide (TPR) repeat protein
MARYRDLATTFHPDRSSRFAPRDADGRTQLDIIFDALTTAFAVLTRPAFRELYDRELARRERERAVRVTAPLAPRVPSSPLVSAPIPTPPGSPAVTTKPLVARPAPQPQESFDTKPLDAADWFRRGEAYVLIEDHTRAVHAFEQCAELAPDKAKVLLALGTSLAKLEGHARRAEEILVRTVQLAPFSVPAYVALAHLYIETARQDDARAQLKRALAIKVDDADALAALAALDGSAAAAVKQSFGS